MREERFVASRRAAWADLAALLERARASGVSSLSGAEVRRLGARYRAAASDLALALGRRYSAGTVQHVNRLCVAAHGVVYAGGARHGFGARALAVLRDDFPALARRTWRWHAAAAAVAILSGVTAYLAFRADPDLAERTLGSVFRDRAERAAAAPEDARRYVELPGLWAPLVSWGIMANNIRVALIAFALGAAGAVPGVVLLAVQGVNVGGGLAVFHGEGVASLLWTFMAAHGPLELTAIFIAGGAGMRLAVSSVIAGRRSRAAVFRATALESLSLLGGATAMLVVAGLIEGFLSPSDAPGAVKWGVGAVSIALMAWYFAAAGRARHGPTAHPA